VTTILVTGATSGLGLETARAFVQRGASVVVTGRSAERSAAAAAAVSAAGWLAADFADLDQVAALADEFRRRYDRLDLLVNNAGAVFPRRRLTRDGVEMTFAVNHLAAFVLTTQLLDMLVASAPSGIVNVTSVAHTAGELDLDDLDFADGYRPYRAYARSKLANVMFTYELAQRLEGTGVTANAFHPGLVRTQIGAKAGRLSGLGWAAVQWRWRHLRIEPDEAAQRLVKVACSPENDTVTGAYFDGDAVSESSASSRDEAAWKQLWTVSEQLASAVSSRGTSTG
jgi:NAD(P)-dependent dehydrogenase (short-subunit alcohol dehydrogenase family)